MAHFTPPSPLKRARQEDDDDQMPVPSPRKMPKFNFWESLKSKTLKISDLKLGAYPTGTLDFRVIYKGRLNESQRGPTFSFYVMDESGKIKVFCYGNNAKKWHDLIKYNEIFSLSNFVVKPSNPVYSPSIGKDIQVELVQESLLERSHAIVPELKLVCTKLNSLAELVGKTANVVAIVAYPEDVKLITRHDGRQVNRREVLLTDDTGEHVSMYLWDKYATEVDFKRGEVIEIHALRLGLFNDETALTFGEGSSIVQDSNSKEADFLRNYLDERIRNANASDASATS